MKYERLSALRVIGGILVGMALSSALGQDYTGRFLSLDGTAADYAMKALLSVLIAATLYLMEQHFLLISSAFLKVDAKINSPAFAPMRRSRLLIRLSIPFLVVWTIGIIGIIDEPNTAYALVLGYLFINVDMFSFMLRHDGYRAIFLCNDKNDLALLITAYPGKISSVEIRSDGDAYLAWDSGANDRMTSKVNDQILEASKNLERVLIVHMDENGHPALEYLAPIVTDGSGPQKSTWDHGENKLDGFVSDLR